MLSLSLKERYFTLTLTGTAGTAQIVQPANFQRLSWARHAVSGRRERSTLM